VWLTPWFLSIFYDKNGKKANDTPEAWKNIVAHLQNLVFNIGIRKQK